MLKLFNPFLANVPILYPLNTPENLWFSGVFREYKMETLARNGLNKKKNETNYERFPQISTLLWEPKIKWVPRELTRVNTVVVNMK